MAGGLVAILTVDGLLGLLDNRVRELHNRAAFDADEVVVMAVPVGMLVLAGTVVRTGTPREARLSKELDGAKHGGLPYAGVDAPSRSDELVGGDVALGIQEGAEDRLTGPGHLQTALAKVALENRSCLTLHFRAPFGYDIDYQYHNFNTDVKDYRGDAAADTFPSAAAGAVAFRASRCYAGGTNRYLGFLVGMATRGIIGIFHPIVIKFEYYLGKEFSKPGVADESIAL